jgi:hypothetical protein
MISKSDNAKMSHQIDASATADSLAPAAAMTENWMTKTSAPEKSGEIVSANELTSLSALIVYVAKGRGLSEFRVERNLADRFNIANVKCLPARFYDEAVLYLVDQAPAVVAA